MPQRDDGLPVSENVRVSERPVLPTLQPGYGAHERHRQTGERAGISHQAGLRAHQKFGHHKCLYHFKEKFGPEWTMMYFLYTAPIDLVELPRALESPIQPS